MFERYITNVLTTHFGHLIEGLDKDRIRLSAWSGELVLNDLALRRDALDHWITDCPIEICYGRIGNLEIRIPWKLIRSQLRWRTSESPPPPQSQNDDLKCTVVLTNVQILATPRKEARPKNSSDLKENVATETDGASEEDKQRQLEEAVEAALEKQLIKQAASASSPAANGSPMPMWVHERVAEILANLVITVRNVHVRYEDPGNCMGFAWKEHSNESSSRYRPPFSIGVLLQEFIIRSAGTDRESLTRHRIGSAKDVAAYWDSNCVLASDLEIRHAHGRISNQGDFFREAFRVLAKGALPPSFMSDFSTQSSFQSRHTFFLDPFSPSIELTLSPGMNASATNSESSKHVSPPLSSAIDAYFPPCQITISRNLLEDIVYLKKSFGIWANFRQNKSVEETLARLSRLRPTQSPLVQPRQWWLYAFQVVIAFQSLGQDHRTSAIMTRRRRGWIGVAQILGKRKKYLALYQNIFRIEDEHLQQQHHVELMRLEAGLTVDEIVAFRLHTYATMRRTSGESSWAANLGARSIVESNTEPPQANADFLMVQQRKRAFVEMARFLDSESKAEKKPIDAKASKELKPVLVTSLQCPEFALRVDDQRSRKRQPVVRLSCAFLQKQEIFFDGSWNMSYIIGDLVLKDCSTIASPHKGLLFPHLVGPRKDSNNYKPVDDFKIDNKYFKESMSVRIRRDFSNSDPSGSLSTTSTVVRMHSLEIVFVTKPVEALNRIFRAVNVDFTDDYHRMVAKLTNWKEKQQRRFLMALAHKETKVLVDLDLGAPIVLFPESDGDNSILVAVDLGQLNFANVKEAPQGNDGVDFDDYWKLDMTQIQMVRCSVNDYREIFLATRANKTAPTEHSMQSLVEPFSVTLMIETKVSQGVADTTQVRVVATLPRLAFNLTSSTVRLLRSLSQQWKDRLEELRPKWKQGCPPSSRNSNRWHVRNDNHSEFRSRSTNRKIDFQFKAPLFQLHMEDDIGELPGSTKASFTPLFDLTLRGIEGLVISEVNPTVSRQTCSSTLHGLTLKDLYQNAGDDFSFMISSVDPALILASPISMIQSSSTTDLVSIKYVSEQPVCWMISPEVSNYLTINFHELFIEWNPETIATIHKAVHNPPLDDLKKVDDAKNDVDSSIYFDAKEDDFFDAESVVSESSGETFLVSEISESVVSSFADLKNDTVVETSLLRSLPFLGSPLGLPLRPRNDKNVTPIFLSQDDDFRTAAPTDRSTPMLVTFEMTKLRINFNKETRHRRVFTTEMDLCRVDYQKRSEGGYRVSAVIGNLFFTDPGSVDNKTLYRELLGVKTDQNDPKPSSLLEMTFLKNPRSRKYLPTVENQDAVLGEDCVSVDLSNGTVYGYDSKIEAHLSPMRFVYIQQLWFEIIDYFFEGIVGYEVWGGKRPLPLDPVQLEQEAADAVEKTGFNAFDILLEAPTILLPVSYCSTGFIRIECDQLSIRNDFRRRPMRFPGKHSVTGEPLMQWYNNVSISLDHICISNASGNILSAGDRVFGGLININWPMGRTAIMNSPKWEIKCSFGELSLTLRKEDFALLQHIISFNIGEQSRNMDEWVSLQSLPRSSLQNYLASVMVTFGYDQKDVAPATFDVSIAIPRVRISFYGDSSHETSICALSELNWSYTKHADFVSKQLIHCCLEVIGEAGSGHRKLIDGKNQRPAHITYSSSTSRTGDNARTVLIENPLIQADIQRFQNLSNFFRSLPQPTFLSPDEVIQIGDRWYRIGVKSPRQIESLVEERKMNWLPGAGEYSRASDSSSNPVLPTYTFDITLKEAQIVLGNNDAAATLLVDLLDFSHSSKAGIIRRKYIVRNVRIGLARNRDHRITSLIEPWSFTATTMRCNGQRPCACPMHSDKISIGKIWARVSFSEMLIGMDVALHIKRDLQASSTNRITNGSEAFDAVQTSQEKGLSCSCVTRFLLVSGGIHVVIVDDSGRHFSGSQELVEVSSDIIDFRTEERVRAVDGIGDAFISGNYIEKSVHLRLRQLDVFDCLQARKSPFRHVIGLRPSSLAPKQGALHCTPFEKYEEVQIPDLGHSEMKEDSMSGHEHALEVLGLVNAAQVYSIILGNVDVQYNPSMIIAFQRFLGRLSKRFKERTAQDREKNDGKPSDDSLPLDSVDGPTKVSRGTFECGRLCICLNKEHQKRRLLRSTLSSCFLDVLNDKDGSTIQGHVDDFQSFVLEGCLIGRPEKNFINACNHDRHFLKVLYRTYSAGDFSKGDKDVPDWLQSHLHSNAGRIDDFVDVSMSSLDVRVVRNHIEELVDYLSNGMPGKGMGATSRAAKGFVKKRIEKRSYFHLDIEAPKLSLPFDDTTAEGVDLKLGDVLVESWISQLAQNDGCRFLKASIHGVECTTIVAGSPILNKVDLMILAETSLSNLSLSARISDVQLFLSYKDYVILLNVFRSNLMRPVDKKDWDNLEAQWEKEQAENNKAIQGASTFTSPVAYASSARYVRFGEVKSRSPATKPTTSRVRLSLARLSVTLSRDTPSCDFLFFQGQGLEASCSESSEGDKSCSLSLEHIYLFDLGERWTESKYHRPRKASIVMEGYSPPEMRSDAGDQSVSHFVLKIDRDLMGETKATVVLSYLSIAVLQNFLQETAGFIMCTWPGPDGCKFGMRDESGKSTEKEGRQSPKGTMQLRFVLHYPRFIFVADESDPRSKALVLRGLAIANGYFRSYVPDETTEHKRESLTRINADLQNISSYIHADVSDILTPRIHHLPIIGDHFFSENDHEAPEFTSQSNGEEDFGIPLLLPLTVGMELEKVQSPRYGLKQSVSINVDPLSVVVGSEDVNLIKSVLSKWSSTSKAIRAGELYDSYNVVFETEKLGVGLKKEDGLVIVDSVKQDAESKGVRVGDFIHGINGKSVELYIDGDLIDFVNRLANVERPVTLTLSRQKATSHEKVTSQPGSNVDRSTTFDVNLSSAVLSLVERDFPLLKGEVLSSRLAYKMDEKKDKCVNLSISASVGVEYYNFRIWGWEPLFEHGRMIFSADFQDDKENPRQLTLEFSDSDDGLAFNATSAAVEAISKLLSWSTYTSQFSHSIESVAELDDTFSPDCVEDQKRNVRSAATAALVYARKQKNGSARPFVFRNRTGLSVAFVQQKRLVSTELSSPAGMPFLSVGEYRGLEKYDPSLITVVGNGQDIKFRVDTDDGLEEGYSSLAKVPIICVSLQTVAGVVIEPLMGLEIDGPGEKILPLRFYNSDQQSSSSHGLSDGIQPVSWCVEIIEEKTIITLGSSIRVLSLLSSPVEVGISLSPSNLLDIDESVIESVGTAYPKSYFFLPVWLGMTGRNWSCSVRKNEEYKFTPLFYSTTEGGLDFGPLSEKTIECTFKRSKSPSSWISVATCERDKILTVTLDSSVSLRNLLPVDLEWEVTDLRLNPTDGSTIIGTEGFDNSTSLESGEKIEIFTKFTDGITARFRPYGFSHWSEHVSLSLDTQKSVTTESLVDAGSSDQSERVTVRYVQSRDAFGVPHDVLIRIMKKDCGLDVTVFAELWLANCTSLDITFGYPCEPSSSRYSELTNEFVEDEFSAADAALREISSLFEGGGETNSLGRTTSLVAADLTRIPGQSVSSIVEECFEYIDQGNGNERRWWASQNPMNILPDPREIDACDDFGRWFWKDKDWQIDYAGSLSQDGWESCPNQNNFSGRRVFNANHRFRRRRWYRRRSGIRTIETHASGIHGYYQPRRDTRMNTKTEKPTLNNARIGIQVNGGRWAISSDIPNISGRIYGAIRARGSRWPELTLIENRVSSAPFSTSVFELCYAISPLDGAWGEFSRLLTVTSRFLLSNNSRSITFEVKQTGSSDNSSVKISPGETLPFHWTDCRRPELLSVRPFDLIGSEHRYKWSGGFDPLTIGALPLRIQERKGSNFTHPKQQKVVSSIKMNSEIRRGTGGTGINLSFEEEEHSGDGALFRIENSSTFPVWISQDGVLANPSRDVADVSSLEGTMVSPHSTACFALDVPFRQGKYTGRKAATIAELLRVRLGLSPLNSRTGIETTKVLCLAKIGTRVRLNPTKLSFLHASLRSDLDRVRVLGVVTTDGPTTVLSLCMIEKDSDNFLVNPFSMDESMLEDDFDTQQKSTITQLIVHAANETVIARCKEKLPTEIEVMNKKLYRKTNSSVGTAEMSSEQNGDLQISLRVSLRGLVVSLVDSAPSEIAVLTLKNVNAIASWNIYRTTNAAVIITVTDLQVDNMISNAPYPVAVSPIRELNNTNQGRECSKERVTDESGAPVPPVLVIGLSFAPKHKTGTVCLRSVTVAPRDLAVRVDLAFLVRLQKFALELEGYFHKQYDISDNKWPVPDIKSKVEGLEVRALSNYGMNKFFFSGFTILPHHIKLSVAPARALTGPQAALEGKENAALHQAVRKGDVRLDRSSTALLGVRIGRTNRTAVAVLRGVFKSIVVDALLRLDGASVNFGGVSLRNHIATGSQLSSQLGAHYLASLRQNVPALLGSLAALGNPIGLARGLGDGVRDLIFEPVKGFQRSVQEMDASHLVDGVARGTLSLARHTVGGFADSAAMLTETFSKNMAVLTLDRRYAQKRDRGEILRDHDDINVALGLGSGVQKLITGFLEGVTGVVKAPIRGAEKKGLEGFAKGIGKGLLGLLVKPIIGLSDGIADVMLGVKGSVEGATGVQNQLTQLRPRRAFYGRERSMRPYNMADAAASALFMRTRLAGEEYFDHLDMGDRLVLLSVRRLLILGSRGQELLLVRLKHIESLEVRNTQGEDTVIWSILVLLNTPRSNGSDVEVIACKNQEDARELCSFLEKCLKRLRTHL